jgi:hypothetical protein
MTERESLQKQIEENKRRLAVLELQYAQFGSLHAPPHLITQIEDARKEINRLEALLAEIKQRYRLAVCLVYAETDAANALELSDRLKEDGFTISSAEGSAEWQKLLEAEISQSDAVILCLSRSALQDAFFVESKLVYALEFTRRLGAEYCTLITVLLDYCEPPSRLNFGLPVHLYPPRRQYSMLRSRLQVRASSLSQNRYLDVAVPEQAQKERAIELLVLARLPDSTGLRKLLGASREYTARPEEVESKSFDLEFPRNEQGEPGPVELWVKLETTDFNLPQNRKKLVVPPESDSGLLTFLLTPHRTGTLKLLIQVDLPDETPLLSMLLQVESRSAVPEETLKAALRVMSVALGAIGVRKPRDGRYLAPGVTLLLSAVVVSSRIEKALPAVKEEKKPVGEAGTEREELPAEILNPNTSHKRRLAIGKELNRRGDRRAGVGVGSDSIPDIAWLPVAPGGWLTIEGTAYQVKPLYIAKYPVTYGQYEAFVKARDGYNNPEWWRGMPSKYRPQELLQRDKKEDNRPHDNISWYQAVAFTRWLNQRLRGLKLPNPDDPQGSSFVVGENIQVRLPTEWEWQWAAQGGSEKREYPWGKWRDGYANTWESGLKQTVAVGLYPQGAAKCGALDMSGNVWEWCLNKYDKPGEVRVDDSGEYRVLRGGSFCSVRDFASCGYRGNFNPNYFFYDRGFRVVVGAALSRL